MIQTSCSVSHLRWSLEQFQVKISLIEVMRISRSIADLVNFFHRTLFAVLGSDWNKMETVGADA